MIITLLFFAAVRELVGRSEHTCALPPHVRTIGQLSLHVELMFPPLRGRLHTVRWARNEELVEGDAPLAEGDVVALIPPVAGGR